MSSPRCSPTVRNPARHRLRAHPLAQLDHEPRLAHPAHRVDEARANVVFALAPATQRLQHVVATLEAHDLVARAQERWPGLSRARAASTCQGRGQDPARRDRRAPSRRVRAPPESPGHTGTSRQAWSIGADRPSRWARPARRRRRAAPRQPRRPTALPTPPGAWARRAVTPAPARGRSASSRRSSPPSCSASPPARPQSPAPPSPRRRRCRGPRAEAIATRGRRPRTRARPRRDPRPSPRSPTRRRSPAGTSAALRPADEEAGLRLPLTVEDHVARRQDAARREHRPRAQHDVVVLLPGRDDDDEHSAPTS